MDGRSAAVGGCHSYLQLYHNPCFFSIATRTHIISTNPGVCAAAATLIRRCGENDMRRRQQIILRVTCTTESMKFLGMQLMMWGSMQISPALPLELLITARIWWKSSCRKASRWSATTYLLLSHIENHQYSLNCPWSWGWCIYWLLRVERDCSPSWTSEIRKESFSWLLLFAINPTSFISSKQLSVIPSGDAWMWLRRFLYQICKKSKVGRLHGGNL